MDLLMRESCDDEFENGEGAKEEGPDLPPEYCHYRDEGCEYAAACLECPFPECLFDKPWGRQKWFKGQRNREIERLYRLGWKISQIAMLFGVSQRTVQRAIKKSPGKSSPDNGT